MAVYVRHISVPSNPTINTHLTCVSARAASCALQAIKESFELVAKAKSEKKAGQRKAAPPSTPPADSKKKQ